MSNVQSCYQCGKCTSVCPMRRVSKTSPRLSIYNANVYGLGTDGIWTCLTCGLCQMECPQQVEFLNFIREERREKKPLDIAHLGIFSEFTEFSSRLPGKKAKSNESMIGYFPGCVDLLGLFLHDMKTDFGVITASSIKLLNKLGIKCQIMDMKCCGHDVLWQGKNEVFENLKNYNTNYIKESGIDTLITSCAECYRTLSKDYNLGIRIVHISELLYKLGLSIDAEVTYHDPCRLGRHMDMYEAPRIALASNGIRIKEMEHSKNKALCCGVSSFMNCNEQTKALRILRMDEAMATDTKTMITTCPKCLAHFNCLKNEKEPERIYDFEIVDLCVFLARGLDSEK